MKNKILGLIAIGLLAGPTGSLALPILQDSQNTGILIEAFQPLGQSFIAEDAYVSFAFYFQPFNPDFPNDPLELRLLSGDGLGGVQLGVFSFSIASGFSGYFDVDLSIISLIVGQTYTVGFAQFGLSPYWGVTMNDGGNPYSGGRGYFTEIPGVTHLISDAMDDFRFRVTPNAASVPEPGTLALLGLGLVGLGFSRRRKLN